VLKVSSDTAQLHNLAQLSCSAVCWQQPGAVPQMDGQSDEASGRTSRRTRRYLRDSRGIAAFTPAVISICRYTHFY